MRFSRLQAILTLLCLAAFGASVGFLLAGVPTTMPLWLLVFLFILVMTLIQGRILRGARAHFRNGVRNIAPIVGRHARNLFRGAGRNAGAIGRRAWGGVRRNAARANPHVRGWFRNTMSGIGRNIGAFFSWCGNIVQRDPNLSFGIASLLVAFVLFMYSYRDQNMGEPFHWGMFALLCAVIFFINYNGWSLATRFLTRNRNGVWLVASFTAFALSYGHGWSQRSLVISAVSTLLAIITICGWWRGIRRFFWNILSGRFGWGVAFITYAGIIFIFFLGPVAISGQELSVEMEKWFSWATIAFALFIVLGPILLVERAYSQNSRRQQLAQRQRERRARR